MARYTKKYTFSLKTEDGNLASHEVPYLPLRKRENIVLLGEDAISNEAIGKLSALEDIEEELGIDLITLCKAFKNGFWTKGGCLYEDCCLENEPQFVSPKEIELGVTWYAEKEHKNDVAPSLLERDVLCLYAHEYEDTLYKVKVKDYGRTWALTKEELE